MKFALLGVDDESLTLVDAAVNAGHRFVWCGDFSKNQNSDRLPTDDRAEHWQDLFDADVADAVVVGRGVADDDLRSQQLQDLAKAGRPVLAVHPVVSSVLSYFEIDMARGESQALIRYYNPLTDTPMAGKLARWVVEPSRDPPPQDPQMPDIGPIEQIAAIRALADRNRKLVLNHFARDVQLLAQIAGSFDRIGSHGADTEDASYAALAVQLVGPNRVPVRWTVGPVDDAAGLRIELIGQHGRIIAEFDKSNDPRRSYAQIEGQRTDLPIDSHDSPSRAIAEFVAAIESPTRDASNWNSALQAMELTDSIEISLRRGRMIDVHHQHLTEHLAFKGSMAAAGCGLLLVLPPVLLLLGWLAGLLGAPVARYWPHALGLLLALFLALQLLPKFLYGSDQDDRGN